MQPDDTPPQKRYRSQRSLLAEIATFLKANPGSTARQVSHAVGCDSDGSRVGTLMKRNPDRFIRVGTADPINGTHGVRPATWALNHAASLEAMRV